MTCSCCGGTGWVDCDTAVPYGDTWVTLADREPCPDCLDRGLCPRCGEAVEWAGTLYAGGYHPVCTECDWQG